MSASDFPSREVLTEAQREVLNGILPLLARQNPFYASRLCNAGFSAGIRSLGDYLERMPFTVKSEIAADQAANPPYGTNLTYPLETYTRFHQTSGTTGQPLRWLDTQESWSALVEVWAEVLRVSGVGREDRIFFAFSFGPFLGFWTAFEAGLRLGAMCIPGGGMNTTARLRAILDNGATALCCTPTYAIRLGEAALEEGIDLSQSAVRTVVVAGEPGAGIPATRERILNLWGGATLKDHHGMTETGPVTYECPSRQGVLHVAESAFLPEVLNPDTLKPVAAGEQGELVLTTLRRVASPLLRYRTGDLVLPSAESPCVCGRHDLALEGGILGRVDDMAVVRGVNLYPSAVEAILRGFPEIVEYRVRLYRERAMWEVEIQIEPHPDCPPNEGLQERTEAALRTAFNLRIPVQTVECGALPRFEMKAKRWVTEAD